MNVFVTLRKGIHNRNGYLWLTKSRNKFHKIFYVKSRQIQPLLFKCLINYNLHFMYKVKLFIFVEHEFMFKISMT